MWRAMTAPHDVVFVPSHVPKPSPSSMPPITSGNSFTVHTGNLNNYIELVTRRHKNSAAEIATAFKHLAAQNTVFRITEGVFSPTTEILQHPKNDVKTSLKVCLSTFSASDVENAVQVTLDTLKMGTLSQLIVSFPYDESTDLSDSDWLEKVRPIWAVVESLVDRDLVHSVGVSDLDVDRLRLICEDAKEHKPTIDHYSIDGCCAVPAELVEYAKAHDIQLLTHNDPRNCDLDADVFDSIGKITDTGRNLTYKWAARYTIWIRSRSVMAAKGYFVQFRKN
nr:Protein E01A2.1, isoform a [Haemonchus contortus]